MRVVMYLFVNKGLGMTAGKVGAQAAHAAVEAYRLSTKEGVPKTYVKSWYEGKHYTKLVMEARNEQHLQTIQDYLKDRGYESAMIIDEGMTEIDPHVKTALGVVLVDKDDPHTAATFSTFRLYKDTIRATIELER